MKSSDFYRDVLEVFEEYLGPAGERFLQRQIKDHMKIKPDSLQPTHIPKLLKWSNIAMALVTKDTEELEAFSRDLQSFTTKKVTSGRG